MVRKHERSCGQKLCCWSTILCMLAVGGTLTWYFAFFAKDVAAELASCGSCHCIPDSNTTTDNNCPVTNSSAIAVTEFTKDQINTWKSQTAINPYTLNCNPFEDGTFCDTEPPLDSELLRLLDEAVCAIHYEQSLAADGVTQLCENTSYRLKTYPSQQEAEAAGGYVTHLGHCGVCSTMQDMAVYAQHLQPTSPGNFCRRQSFTSLENGMACYISLGMTQDCARIWADTSWNTATSCFRSCVLDPTLPQVQLPGSGSAGSGGTSSEKDPDTIDFNATGTSSSSSTVASLEDSSVSRSANISSTSAAATATSECQPDACQQCDHDASSRFFERYAGRTRGRSGMLGTSVMYCSKLAAIVQDPCPQTTPLVD